MVLRAGFEPANPCGKGFPIWAHSGQMFDLESLVERAYARSFTFDLAWLPQHTLWATDFSVFFLINHLPLLCCDLDDFFKVSDEAFKHFQAAVPEAWVCHI